jgi:hypothetical protein
MLLTLVVIFNISLLLLLDFSYCCDRHDACYGMCGAPKAYCDDDFKSCMLKQCSTTYSKNKQCPTAAEVRPLQCIIVVFVQVLWLIVCVSRMEI